MGKGCGKCYCRDCGQRYECDTCRECSRNFSDNYSDSGCGLKFEEDEEDE